MKNVIKLIVAVGLILTSFVFIYGQNDETQETSQRKQAIAIGEKASFVSPKRFYEIEKTPKELLIVKTFLCNATWSRTNSSQSRKHKVELKVGFDQHSESDYSVTTFSITVTKLKRKCLFFWINATANSLTLDGQFSGPRTPLDINGNYGYLQSNPFTINYSSPIIHYRDYSYQNLPCYTMTSGTYTILANFNNGNISTSVSW